MIENKFNLKRLNQIIKETRISKGITLEEAAENTKIRKTILNDIEEGNYSSIDSEVHLKNFLISYGKFLGLNEEKILALYRRDKEQKLAQEKKQIKFIQNKNITINKLKKIIFSVKFWIFVVILFSIGLIFFFFYKIWETANLPPYITIISPQNNEIITTDTFVIEGISSNPQIKIYLNGTEANYIDTLGRFRINAKFNEPGIKRFTIIAENQFKNRKEYYLDLIYQPPKKVEIGEKDNLRFVIKLTNNSKRHNKIDYTIDGIKQYLDIKPYDSKEILIEGKEIILENINNNEISIYLVNKINQIEHQIKFDKNKIFIKILEGNTIIIQI